VEFALALLLLAALIVVVVIGPLRRGREPEPGEDERRAALDAAKEAKYREIRDAELDFGMGKLSEADYRQTDGELRAQAIEILRELDELSTEERRGRR
jgi:hypothetical protein